MVVVTAVPHSSENYITGPEESGASVCALGGDVKKCESKDCMGTK